MDFVSRHNLAPKLNMAMVCAALVFMGAIVAGVF
jgi:hypothetical protein